MLIAGLTMIIMMAVPRIIITEERTGMMTMIGVRTATGAGRMRNTMKTGTYRVIACSGTAIQAGLVIYRVVGIITGTDGKSG